MDSLTNRSIYDARGEDGRIYGGIGPRDWDRFRQTLRFIPKNVRTLLDCGCDRGHWLHYITSHRDLRRHVGVDVSEERIKEAKAMYPELAVRAAYLETLDMGPRSHEVVTCLEVLEHIPAWEEVLKQLLGFADRRVVITVPFKERIIRTPCIHCGKLTPLYGHLRTYDEGSFPDYPGWKRSYGYIRDRGIGARGVIRRLYRRVRRRRNWLVALYDRRGAS